MLTSKKSPPKFLVFYRSNAGKRYYKGGPSGKAFSSNLKEAKRFHTPNIAKYAIIRHLDVKILPKEFRIGMLTTGALR